MHKSFIDCLANTSVKMDYGIKDEDPRDYLVSFEKIRHDLRY